MISVYLSGESRPSGLLFSRALRESSRDDFSGELIAHEGRFEVSG
jgi:hypothetical protein